MITRFAPSPTGPLHLGHAYAAITAHDMARSAGGRFILRIEDLDQSRARPAWEAQIYDDLAWLGLAWARPVMRQSERGAAYEAALARLEAMGLTYRCRCTRADIRAALSAPQEGANLPLGPDGLVYPGTCRGGTLGDTVRLDMARALASLHENGREPGLNFFGNDHFEQVSPHWLIANVGDVVLARQGMGAAYHLAVVVDDAAQGITMVTRGEDLREATAIHVLLQRLLELPQPRYCHHRLIRDDTGKRLAKRDDARALFKYRAEGASPDDIRRLLGLSPSG